MDCWRTARGERQTPETERDNVTVHRVVILRGAITPRVQLISTTPATDSLTRSVLFFRARHFDSDRASFSVAVLRTRVYRTNENLSANAARLPLARIRFRLQLVPAFSRDSSWIAGDNYCYTQSELMLATRATETKVGEYEKCWEVEVTEFKSGK